MYLIVYKGIDVVFSSEFLDEIEEWFEDNNAVEDEDYRVEFDSLEDE